MKFATERQIEARDQLLRQMIADPKSDNWYWFGGGIVEKHSNTVHHQYENHEDTSPSVDEKKDLSGYITADDEREQWMAYITSEATNEELMNLLKEAVELDKLPKEQKPYFWEDDFWVLELKGEIIEEIQRRMK